MLPFLVSVILTGFFKISKMRYHWKDLSLKLLFFINLYPASRSPSIFLDKLGRLKRSIAWWDKTGTILEPRMNRVSKHENRVSSFEKPAFLYSPLERISGNDLFLEKHNNNHSQLNWMHGPTDLASLYKYNLSEVKFKFLGDKKGPTKGFYLEVWKIDSVFLYQVYLLNYHNCFYICEGVYNAVNNKRLKHDLE